jgi:hypothetical protein
MNHRLNGWQRLWIVFCGLYLIATGIFTASILPTGFEHGRKRVLDSIDLVSRHTSGIRLLEDAGFSKSEIEDYLAKGAKFGERLAKGPTTEQESAETIRAKYYADLSDKEILARLHEKYSKKVDFGSVDAEYQKDMARLRGERVRVILYVFFVWCGTSLGLYGFGFAMAWVIRGFRQRQSS